ncbi:protein-disulfide reductase DsbD N-terminal domain-containing protein [Acinetobacter amyesii]|uniref:protein-disulfide reductase DsbD N-terminal domain-containing protein n=1 Tax=Acinetobacter amyesii TaxID=2942470 RepID=UPI003D2FF4D9
MQRASADFLPPDQAFAFKAVSTAQDTATFTWRIADGYYLYHDQLKVIENGKALSLQLPRPQQKDDPNFGMTDVHYGQVQATVAMQPNQSYKIEWQGCAESGLCYPVQRTTIQTDAYGLLPASNLSQQSTTQKKLLDAVTSSSLPNTAMPADPQAKNTETATFETQAKKIKQKSKRMKMA